MSSPVPAEQPTTATPTLFGREPALLLGAIYAAIALFSATVLPLTADQQGWLNMAVAAVLGLVLAIKVRGGTWAAALMTAFNVVLAAALAFGLDLAPGVQSSLLAFVAAVLSYATRAIVVPPQPAALPGSSRVA